MPSSYWFTVLKRVISLGKTVVEMSVPAAVDYGIVKAVEKVCSVVEEKLNAWYWQTVKNAGISFVLNVYGVLNITLKPLGEKASVYAGWGLFFASFCFWLYRTLRFWKNNGKTVFAVTGMVFEEHSLYKGIEKYILSNFPMISLAYTGIQIGSQFIPSLKEVPSIHELASYLVKIFWKRVALFLGLLAVYTVSIYWILKPWLLRKFG